MKGNKSEILEARTLNWEKISKKGQLSDAFEQIPRRMEVARLKEIYSKKYLLESKLVTHKEYVSIPASTLRADTLRRYQDEAILRNQVVGAEIY